MCSVIRGLIGNDLLLDGRQQLLRLGQGQPKVRHGAEAIGLDPTVVSPGAIWHFRFHALQHHDLVSTHKPPRGSQTLELLAL